MQIRGDCIPSLRTRHTNTTNETEIDAGPCTLDAIFIGTLTGTVTVKDASTTIMLIQADTANGTMLQTGQGGTKIAGALNVTNGNTADDITVFYTPH